MISFTNIYLNDNLNIQACSFKCVLSVQEGDLDIGLKSFGARKSFGRKFMEKN